ncbi:ATP-binding cassette domain-containing protein [Streptomyces sp. NPDC004065]|uniref:ABC transporter ATP-binding protein n=1 Tax=Streptomyces sp. NPDC004065 TaxID=3364689 RepID=UPI0038508A5D
MIQAFGLTSDSRKGLPPAVDDVSFDAHTGRVTALLGAPGAGKTTTLRLMLELQPGRGITYFKGRPLHRIAHPAHEVGALLGDVPGHPSRTVRGHLRMLCAAAGLPARRADEVLEVVGLVSLREERLGTLARAADRRLGLACVLLADPHTLVLDEPADGLSVRENRWLHGMLRAHAAQGGTVLFTTADPKEAAGTADRVVTIERGRLVADQEAADFARHRLRPRVAVRSPHAARLAALLAKEARTARRSVEVVHEEGNRLSVYGSTCADVGEAAFRHGILVHQLADEVGDMGPGAGAVPAHTTWGAGQHGTSSVSRTAPGSTRSEGAAVATGPGERPVTAASLASSVASVSEGSLITAVSGADGESGSDAGSSAGTPVTGRSEGPAGPAGKGGAPLTARVHGGTATAEPGQRAARDGHAAGTGDADGQDGQDGQDGHDGLHAPSATGDSDGPRAASRPGTTTGGTHAPQDRPRPAPPHPAIPTPRPAEAVTFDASSPLPPPISVRPGPSPLRPLRYELRRAAGIGTGFVTCAAVLTVSAVVALVLGRIGHTPQPRLLAAWPRQLPLPPAALGAGLLGALSFGDEFRHPALAADRGTVPRRLGLLCAKLLVAAGTALMLAFLTVGCDAELLYVVHGRELTQVPGDWLRLGVSWTGLMVGSAWTGVLAAGLFRSTTAGLAAVVAVPVVVVPLLRAASGGTLWNADGLPARLRRSFLLQWPFGGDQYLAAAARLIAQPMGGALALCLVALGCAYVVTALRGRSRWPRSVRI